MAPNWFISVAIMFCMAILMITISELINIKLVVGTQIPTLSIANELVPIVGMFFSMIILLGVYSTVSPILWATVRKFADDKTKKSVILAIIGILFGQLIPFDVFVNTLYPFSGYFGLIFLAFMVVKQIKNKLADK